MNTVRNPQDPRGSLGNGLLAERSDSGPISDQHGSTMDIAAIRASIPHRYPFLLVDRIVDIKPMESAIGIKQVSINEPFFMGHFPEHPVMPGVLIVESMAQTATAFMGRSLDVDPKRNVVYMRGVDNAKFRQAVVPGDSLRLHVKLLRRRRELWLFSGVAKVDDIIVAESRFSAVLRNIGDE